MILFVFFYALFVELDVVKRVTDQAVRVGGVNGARRIGQDGVVDALCCEYDGLSII